MKKRKDKEEDIQKKSRYKIRIILLVMFIVANLIGLYVYNFYSNGEKMPYGFDQQNSIEKDMNSYLQFFISLIISFAIAIIILFFLMRIKSVKFIKAWFFIVVALAIGLTLTAFITPLNTVYPSIIALFIGIILAYFKMFKRNVILHNLTELIIYPGIAAVFISLLNMPFTVALLIAISLYDMWAVWKSGIMQKMAKFHIDKLGMFSGFLIPYASKKMKEKIEFLKLKYKNKKEIPQGVIKRSKIKINMAALGGGDITFTTIAVGVFFKYSGDICASFIVLGFASLALLGLFIFGDKRKPYPAMPYLTIGIFLGMLIALLLL